jgi:hypothetical protein
MRKPIDVRRFFELLSERLARRSAADSSTGPERQLAPWVSDCVATERPMGGAPAARFLGTLGSLVKEPLPLMD